MRTVLKFVSFAGLVLTLLPSFFVFAGVIELSTNQNLMLVGTILWFVTAPFWINTAKAKK